MARILITGSTDGFGFEAARQLIERKHEVYLHARSQERAEEVKAKCPGAAGVFIADLTTVAETRKLAKEVNAIGGTFDAVILNAGLLYGPYRKTDLGVPSSIFVNLVAPYLLAALITPPKRLIFVASVLHHEAKTDLKDIFWLEREEQWNDFQAYCDTKFHVVLLANAMARRLKNKNTSVISLHPGYVPTKLAGKDAPGKMQDGIETYIMLAEGDYDETLTGAYFDPKRERVQPHALTADEDKQEAVVKACEDLTGVKLENL